mgnify:CR=1 FL=1|jgi:hypothetical protein
MKKLISLLAIPVLLASCTMGPFYLKTAKGTEVVSSGGSIMTKADFEDTYVEKGDFKVRHIVHKKNETSVPNTAIAMGALASSIESTADATKTFSNNKLAETVAGNATKVQLAEKANEAAKITAEAAAAAEVVPAVAP